MIQENTLSLVVKQKLRRTLKDKEGNPCKGSRLSSCSFSVAARWRNSHPLISSNLCRSEVQAHSEPSGPLIGRAWPSIPRQLLLSRMGGRRGAGQAEEAFRDTRAQVDPMVVQLKTVSKKLEKCVG